MSAKEIQNTIIFQHLVKKEFDRADLMCQEVLGTFLAQIVGMTEQKMITDSRCLMMEKVNGVSLTSLSDQIGDELEEMLMEKLALKMVKIKKEYVSEVGNMECFLGAFGYRKLVEKNKKLLIKFFGEHILREISDISRERLTICHGDLNLSNLMLVGSDLVLVDFEHVVEAPIEFDLACSAFFGDMKSLNVDLVVGLLRKAGVEILDDNLRSMTKLYFADQIRKADSNKQKLLFEIAKNKKIL